MIVDIFIRHNTTMMDRVSVPALLLLGAIGLNKALPNDVVKRRLTAFMYRAGVVMTLGLSKHKSVGPIWNRTVEPLVVDLLDNLAHSVTHGLVRGLRSDNITPLPGTDDPPACPDPQACPDNESKCEEEERDAVSEPKKPWWRR